MSKHTRRHKRTYRLGHLATWPGLGRAIALLALTLTLVWNLGVPQPASAGSVTSAAFSGGAGTATVSGTLYAKSGATLTLTVITDNLTSCVEVSGAHTATKTTGDLFDNQKKWVFTFTAGTGDGVRTITAKSYWGVQDGECRGHWWLGETYTTRTASYTLDNTAPVVTGSVAPAPNGAGWNNSDATVTWSASDTGGSGVASGPTPASESQTTNTDGTTKTATASDRVGNSGTGTVSIKLDKDAPAISGDRSPAANANGWNNAAVNVTFTCSDGLSGIDTCTGATTLSGEGPNQSVVGTATDVAGTSASTTVANINIDTTAPTLSGAPTTGPNGNNGWYTSDVSIAWTCGDTGSGIDDCPANSMISGEGSVLTASATVSDLAGNMTSATSSPAVKIDSTAPNTSHDAPTVWNASSLTVTLSPADALSGIAATYYTVDGGAQQSGTSVAISGEGDHTLSFWSVDNAGNVETSQTIQVKIDVSAPSISRAQSPAANANGWNNSAVTVTFTCEDTLSGIATCTAPQTVTSEGQNQSVPGTATNNAGLSATTTATISIDETAPTISGDRTPAANANGWNNTNVTVTFTCDDALSGIDTCTAPQTVTSEGQNQSVPGTATDAAGNTASTTVNGINVDKTDPTLGGAATSAPNASGWYGGDVVIQWTCSDALSGLDGACPAASTITGEGDNLAASDSICDRAGNCTSATVSGIKIDRHAPTTSASVPASPAGGKYTNSVTVTLAATDGLSGIATTYFVLDGGAPQSYTGPFTISNGGAHTVTFWSVDHAGNVEDANSAGHQHSLTIDNNIITFAPLADRIFGDAPFTVSASASSSLTVTFAASGTCSVLGTTVTLTSTGSCTITASQAGDATHNAADPVARTFTITEAAVPNVLLTVAQTSGGTVARDLPGTGSGPYGYPVGTLVTLTPQPAAGQTFIGWTVDGVSAGWPMPLDITMDSDHTVAANFAPTKTFPDVGTGSPYHTAIVELGSRGAIRGYGNGTFGSDNTVLRAQMAALIARATSHGPGTPPGGTLTPPNCLVTGTWDCEDWGTTFTDQGGDPNLWRDAGTLQHYGVAKGYTQADCTARGLTYPCYGPNDDVTYAQTISFITRMMIVKGYWVDQPGAPLPYTGVPSAHATDLAIFHYYTGGITDAPATTGTWSSAANRGWFAQALWQALDSYFSVDRVP